MNLNIDSINNLLLWADREPETMGMDEQYAASAISAVWKAYKEGRTSDLARAASITGVPYWRTTLNAVDKLLGDADANGYRYDINPKRHDLS